MSSPSDPQPPEEPSGRPQPTTREIPVVQPTAGATAVTPQGPHTATQQATQQHQLPPHPGAITPAPVQVTPTGTEAPQPTGPVGFVPAPPRPAVPPLPPAVAPAHVAAPTSTAAQPAAPVWPESLEAAAAAQERPAKQRRLRAPRDRTALIGLGLVALSLVLLELGLVPDFGGESYWSVVPLWSAFATVCVLLGVLAFAAFYPAGNQLRSGPAWRVAAGGLVGLSVFWLLVVLPVVDTDRGFVLTAALAALGGALWIGPRRKD
ncbi:MAG: hypothetical protein JWR82_875 [Blastococcus sp.]|nr:hypothetical protein [Blastococcus sp.]